MKKLIGLLLIGLLFLSSCVTYKEYTTVTSTTSVPNGTRALIIPNTSVEKMKEAFKNNQIMYKTRNRN